MKKGKKGSIFFIIVIFLTLGLLFWYLPKENEKECKERVFDDLREKSNNALKAIVGIVPEEEKDGLKSRNGLGSGVIFDKKDKTYYFVTAAHVIDNIDKVYKIFTRDTVFSGEVVNTDSDVTFEIPDEKYYESLIPSKIEYISEAADLAILSFQYDGDLPVMEFSKIKPAINDRIVVIGHPEGERYQVTYGYIKSEIKDAKIKDSNDDIINAKVIEHNAYMKPGNSGGVALNDAMQIVGINIGGVFNILGYYDVGYMIPLSIVQENINTWKSK